MATYYSKYPLKGLDCANCARDVENALRATRGFEESRVNFAAGTVSIPVNRIRKAQDIITSFDDDVKIVDSNDDADGEKAKLAIRWILSGLSAAAMVIGLVFSETLSSTAYGWAEIAILLPAYLAVGWPVLRAAGKNLIKGRVFDENFLMTIATIGAMAIREFPEAVGVMVFYSVGENFQRLAVQRSRTSIRNLMDLRSDSAWLVRGEEAVSVEPEEVAVGDIILVKPGEKVPLDGRIIDGESFVDASALTGESRPIRKGPGDDVLSGVVNGEGLLRLEVCADYAHGTVAKIIELVENAANRKAPTERFITKFAGVYTPIMVALAAMIAFLPPIFINGAGFAEWGYRALILLVISCPCALVVSIPLGYFGGIGGGARQGILIKGANYLDALTQVDTVVFDKTGTLTRGVFEVTAVRPAGDWAEAQVLSYAAAAESGSNHPIAKSILAASGFRAGTVPAQFNEVPGMGVIAAIEEKAIVVGNDRLLTQQRIPYTADRNTEVGTNVLVAVDGEYIGSVTVSDRLKDSSRSSVASLKLEGVGRVAMLTGDSADAAAQVAGEIGIDEVRAELLPADKVRVLETMMTGGKTAFVGDGINDAPVIMRADIGIAMGGLGSDAAVEAADIVIMDDDPAKVAAAIRLSKRTRRIVLQNIVFALTIKGLFILMGSVGEISMWQAVFADVGVALLAVLNAMRVLRIEKSNR